jgi:hypothetical protein
MNATTIGPISTISAWALGRVQAQLRTSVNEAVHCGAGTDRYPRSRLCEPRHCMPQRFATSRSDELRARPYLVMSLLVGPGGPFENSAVDQVSQT